MKIFLSWSGELSQKYAAIFHDWLPAVINALEPFYSKDDIQKGSRWSSEIAKVLDASDHGIIFLTKENLEAPWIMFEAGCLSKKFEQSRICTLLFGIEPSEVTGPLVQFQGTPFSKEEVCKLLHSLNSSITNGIATSILDRAFEKWWPELEQSIEEASRSVITVVEAVRTDRDMLEEIVDLTRAITNMPRVAPRTSFKLLPKLDRATQRYLDAPGNMFSDRDFLYVEEVIEYVADVLQQMSRTPEMSNKLSILLSKKKEEARELRAQEDEYDPFSE